MYIIEEKRRRIRRREGSTLIGKAAARRLLSRYTIMCCIEKERGKSEAGGERGRQRGDF